MLTYLQTHNLTTRARSISRAHGPPSGPTVIPVMCAFGKDHRFVTVPDRSISPICAVPGAWVSLCVNHNDPSAVVIMRPTVSIPGFAGAGNSLIAPLVVMRANFAFI